GLKLIQSPSAPAGAGADFLCRSQFTKSARKGILIYYKLIRGRGRPPMEDQQLEQLEGTIEDIIFENSDSGYVVFELSGGGTLTVVCGTLGELHVGQSVVCRGKYETHATYGRQF